MGHDVSVQVSSGGTIRLLTAETSCDETARIGAIGAGFGGEALCCAEIRVFDTVRERGRLERSFVVQTWINRPVAMTSKIRRPFIVMGESILSRSRRWMPIELVIR